FRLSQSDPLKSIIRSFNLSNSCFISVKSTLKLLHFYFLLSMTMFIFLSTSTWTWIIYSHIFFSYKCLSLFLCFSFACSICFTFFYNFFSFYVFSNLSFKYIMCYFFFSTVYHCFKLIISF